MLILNFSQLGLSSPVLKSPSTAQTYFLKLSISIFILIQLPKASRNQWTSGSCPTISPRKPLLPYKFIYSLGSYIYIFSIEWEGWSVTYLSNFSEPLITYMSYFSEPLVTYLSYFSEPLVTYMSYFSEPLVTYLSYFSEPLVTYLSFSVNR